MPVVMQLEALECGAACLTMVLAYYRKWIPLEQVRADCGVSRDGANAKNILRAARSYGLSAKGYHFEPDALKERGSFPCIVHWNFNHFVVLDGFRRNRAYINDPAKGAYSVSMEEFDKAFTGVCLIFEPTEAFVPGGKPKSILAFARSRLAGAGPAIVFVILTTLISSLIGIIKPGFSRVFLDRLLTGKNPEWLYPFTIGLSVFTAVELIVSVVRIRVDYRINGKMAAYGNTSYMWKVLRMPMEFFSQRMAGDIQSRQSANASIAGVLVETFAPLLLHAIMTVIYLVVMIRYSLLLSVIGLASVAIQTGVSQIIAKKRMNITRVSMRDAGMLAGATVAGFEMIETIKASGAENGYFAKWAGYQASVNTQRIKHAKVSQYLGLIPTLVSELTALAVLGIGVYLTMQGKFTVGMIMAFQGYMTSFMAPVNNLIAAGQGLQEMRVDMERIEDVMQYPSDVNADNGPVDKNAECDKLSGHIEMRNVTFGYSRLDAPLIENFSLTLQPGQTVAFVGASGCGKSTLSKLISGLYQPWAGEILFDGKPIRSIDRSVFTGSLAVADQEVILFEDTIANNIKMWDNSIEDFEMILAARDAQLHEDIMLRDGGYQYMLSEGGRDFSGGQRQRMELARVLAQDPTIVILDEATAALDAKTEYNVVRSIRERGITCIVIAHRLSTIRDCNEIIVLDQGKVVERGTHDTLYAKGGLYTELAKNE